MKNHSLSRASLFSRTALTVGFRSTAAGFSPPAALAVNSLSAPAAHALALQQPVKAEKIRTVRIKPADWTETESLIDAIIGAMQKMEITWPKSFLGADGLDRKRVYLRVAPVGRKGLFLSRGTDHSNGEWVLMHDQLVGRLEDVRKDIEFIIQLERLIHGKKLIAIYRGLLQREGSASPNILRLNPALPHKGLIGLILID